MNNQLDSIKQLINKGFDTKTLDAPTVEAVHKALAMLDNGTLAVAEPIASGNKTSGTSGGDNGTKQQWQTNQWLKKAILLYFLSQKQRVIPGIDGASWYDKVPLKTNGWSQTQWQQAGFRMVPGAVVRYGSYVGKSAVLMPSFVNIGAYVGEGTMVDTWATVGSCARVGKNCHISGGAGIGGVLEPLQANPVVIEDNCFIGARSEIAEGVVVGTGAVISMGVYIGASTKIISRDGSKTYMGEVPPYSVVVAGSRPSGSGDNPSLYCAVIIKQVDEKTRAKVSVNELLRE